MVNEEMVVAHVIIYTRITAVQLLCWLMRQRCHSKLRLAYCENRWWWNSIQTSLALRAQRSTTNM